MSKGRFLRLSLIFSQSANLNIPGYDFVNVNSKTRAGGVGMYVSNDLEFSRRNDLDISDDGIESCWIELARTAQKKIRNRLCL